MRDDNAIFRDVTVRVCGDLDIDRALGDALVLLREHLPAEDAGLYTFESDVGAIRLVAFASTAGSRPLAGTSNPLIPISKVSRDQLSGEALPDVRIVSRPASDPVTREVAAGFRDDRDISLLIMRLKIRGRRLGSLILRADGVDRFTQEHAELLAKLNEPFAVALSNALRFEEVERLRDRLAEDNAELRGALGQASGEVIGADFGLRSVMEMARQVAASSTPVLLLGETGTGKEVIAAAIHRLSARRKEPFVKVNCGALPESLVDSELFGHEKGAFTGALAQKPGRFERAHKGTLLLDELGDLPLAAQVKLLRVLQSKELERVGGTRAVPVDVRLIAATHRDLEAMVRSGRFREDLWFRLGVFPIRIPPLRERRSDIPALTQRFVEQKSKEMNLPTTPELAPGAIDRLLSYDWPGNVRELQNVIERALILCRDAPLSFLDLGTAAVREPAPRRERRDLALDAVVSAHLKDVLGRTDGRIEGPGGAAELLGLNPSTLRHKLRKLGIPFGRSNQSKNDASF